MVLPSSLLALLLLGIADDSNCVPNQPCYTAASIANSAANVSGLYSPNSFLTIYGTNLSYVTKPIGSSDIGSGQLPRALGEVGVAIGGLSGYMYYVSPTQVNVLIPGELSPGPSLVQLENRGIYGPPVQIILAAAAPALFQEDEVNIIATHGNGPLVTASSPATSGEIVVLYATGLGLTSPVLLSGVLPATVAQLADMADFRVLLNQTPVDPKLIQYAGDAPGFAGLFQINVQLPADCPKNPEIRIGYGDNLSPAQRYLPVN